MKRRHVLISVAVAAIVAIGVGIWMLWPATPISKANFERIEIGMRQTSVEDILGGRARDESTGKLRALLARNEADLLTVEARKQAEERKLARFEAILENYRLREELMAIWALWHSDPPVPSGRRFTWLEWRSDNAIIGIGFDEENRVCQTECLEVYRSERKR